MVFFAFFLQIGKEIDNMQSEFKSGNMQKAESKNKLKISKISTKKTMKILLCCRSNREIIIGFEENFVEYHTI